MPFSGLARETEPAGSLMRIAYVGPFAYLASNASSLRVAGVARALVAGGADVLIGSGEHEANDVAPSITGITHQALGEFPRPGAPKWRRVLQGMIWGRRTADWIAGLQPKP